MVQQIGISDFRSQMKTFLNEANNSGILYQLGSKETEVLVGSPATIMRLQMRHAINVSYKKEFHALNLGKYLTFVEGVKTMDLPLDIILGLSAFFQLVEELLTLLSYPNVKENAPSWDISKQIDDIVENRSVSAHGKFSCMRTVITRLFENPANGFKSANIKTLADFFHFIERLCIPSPKITDGVKAPDLWNTNWINQEEKRYVAEILEKTSAWCVDLIHFQKITPENDHLIDQLSFRFYQILEWYETYMGALPNLKEIRR